MGKAIDWMEQYVLERDITLLAETFNKMVEREVKRDMTEELRPSR